MAEISYVGSQQKNLPFTTDLNQVPEDKLGPNSAQFRPYPFQSITGTIPEGRSNYNSLQMSVTQRMRSGLTFNFNYTWAHMLSNQESSAQGQQAGTIVYQRAYDPDANYGNFELRRSPCVQGIYGV